MLLLIRALAARTRRGRRSVTVVSIVRVNRIPCRSTVIEPGPGQRHLYEWRSAVHVCLLLLALAGCAIGRLISEAELRDNLQIGVECGQLVTTLGDFTGFDDRSCP